MTDKLRKSVRSQLKKRFFLASDLLYKNSLSVGLDEGGTVSNLGGSGDFVGVVVGIGDGTE